METTRRAVLQAATATAGAGALALATAGGAQAAQLGVCPAAPDHGRDCWLTAGTLCGGSVQGTYAEKLGNCLTCDVYQKLMCGEV